ncbi:hypothetical protein HYH02_006590 [Chlamydomonas schloesseri]|uniref:Nephrocystin 3-like N-terminal domain-containing protein n=1 Tax=Chlamydomonas schloesseri TaxID=2026947 RepID=A0A835W6F0_9CHLO|nr:hypothetical protein HYH02_006590 [Chlamydomonas schloesseri]|eukprot:KAG2439063.1 hypothetical protein HYH02_006590 [Chlamydomonas schloesseri]
MGCGASSAAGHAAAPVSAPPARPTVAVTTITRPTAPQPGGLASSPAAELTAPTSPGGSLGLNDAKQLEPEQPVPELVRQALPSSAAPQPDGRTSHPGGGNGSEAGAQPHPLQPLQPPPPDPFGNVDADAQSRAAAATGGQGTAAAAAAADDAEEGGTAAAAAGNEVVVISEAQGPVGGEGPGGEEARAPSPSPSSEFDQGQGQGPSSPSRLSPEALATTRLGITLRGLRRLVERLRGVFGDDWESQSTADVNTKWVEVVTLERRCRLVEMGEWVAAADVAPPSYFISHTWKNRCCRLLAYILNYLQDAADTTAVWLDILCVNQHEDTAAHQFDVAPIAFSSTVRACAAGTLVVLDREVVSPATRGWCIFEWAHTLAIHGADGLHLHMSAADRAAVWDSIDVERSQCFKAEDKAMILQQVVEHYGSAAAFDAKLKLQLLLQPLSCAADVRRLRARAAALGSVWHGLGRVQAWAEGQGGAAAGGGRLLVVAAGAGEGKSTISAALVNVPDAAAGIAAAGNDVPGDGGSDGGGGASNGINGINGSSCVTAYHFLKHSDARTLEPLAIVKSLAFQLAERLPAVREALLGLDVNKVDALRDAEAAFALLLEGPLARAAAGMGAGESIIILLDALDEADPPQAEAAAAAAAAGGANGGNNAAPPPVAACPVACGNAVLTLLTSLLAPRLPGCVRFIVTTRPDAACGQVLPCLRRAFGAGGGNSSSGGGGGGAGQHVTELVPSELCSTPSQQVAEGEGSSGGGGGGMMVYHTLAAAAAELGLAAVLPPLAAPPQVTDVYRAYHAIFESARAAAVARRRAQLTSGDGSAAAAAAAEAARAAAGRVGELVAVAMAAREPLSAAFLQQLGLAEAVAALPGSPALFFLDEHRLHTLHKSLTEWLTDGSRSGAHAADVALGHRLIGLYLHRTWRQQQQQQQQQQQGATAASGTGSSSGSSSGSDGMAVSSSTSRYLMRYIVTHLAAAADAELGGSGGLVAPPPHVQAAYSAGGGAGGAAAAPLRFGPLGGLAARVSANGSGGGGAAAATTSGPRAATTAAAAAAGPPPPGSAAAALDDLLADVSFVRAVLAGGHGPAVIGALGGMRRRTPYAYDMLRWLRNELGDLEGLDRKELLVRALQAPPRSRLCAAALRAAGQRWRTAAVLGTDGPGDWPACAAVLKGHTGDVGGVAFAPDGRQVAAVSGGKAPLVTLWDVETGRLNAALRQPGGEGGKALVFGRDGRTLLAGCGDTVLLYDVATGQVTATLRGPSKPVNCLALSPDGVTVAASSDDASVCVWDLSATGVVGGGDSGRAGQQRQQQQQQQELSAGGVLTAAEGGHRLAVLALAFSGDGARLASAGRDKVIKVWKSTVEPGSTSGGGGGSELSRLGAQLAAAAAAAGAGARVSGSGGGPAAGWEVCATLTGHTGVVYGCAWSPVRPRQLASGAEDMSVRLWDCAGAGSGSGAGAGACTAVLTSHVGWVRCVAWSPDGRLLASSADDKSVRLWDTSAAAASETTAAAPGGDSGNSGNSGCAAVFAGHSDWVRSVAFAPDGRALLASASRDQTVRLWALDSVAAATPSSGGGAATADAAAAAALTPQQRQLLRGHTSYVRCVRLSADGSLLASCGDDTAVLLWRVAGGLSGGSAARVMLGHGDNVNAVAWRPSGGTNKQQQQQELASASDDKTLRLWSAASGACSRTLQGHEGPVTSLAWYPDGRRLLSGSNDCSARAWDLVGQEAGKECVLTLTGHTGFVTGVAVSGDGATLVTASNDTTLRVWCGRTGRQKATLKGHTEYVTCVAFCPLPGSSLVASGSVDTTVRLWDLASPGAGAKGAAGAAAGAAACIATCHGHTHRITCLAFSGDGKHVVSGGRGRALVVHEAPSGALAGHIHGHPDWLGVLGVGVNPTGPLATIVSGGELGQVRVWERCDDVALALAAAGAGPVAAAGGNRGR